ncbi:MAG: tRNA A37 threonylcarbamoyladenosine dehydratase [Bacteriovoracaceae bacterium]|jgi:tRNA A37 threonylcarbamoyladenosine dehydratase
MELKALMPESEKIRFNGISRLLGEKAQQKIKTSHVCVMGIGGVGSWAVEALARSGVGKITLVDMDEVCLSNVNRQIHALDETVGSSKVSVMKERVLKINPKCEVTLIEKFFTKETAEEILSHDFDYIIDAFDSMWNKLFLIDECVKRKIQICTVGGAGGKSDPTLIRSNDLAFTEKDPFCFLMRKNLKRQYNFTRDKTIPFGVDCVYSLEEVSYLGEDGEVCQTNSRQDRLKLDCASGLGSASFLTGAFGFAAAHQAIKRIST